MRPFSKFESMSYYSVVFVLVMFRFFGKAPAELCTVGTQHRF
jgi:hypothetical protein